jgi:hypothetical protein
VILATGVDIAQHHVDDRCLQLHGGYGRSLGL